MVFPGSVRVCMMTITRLDLSVMPNAGTTFTISGNAYTVSQAGLLTGPLRFSQTVPDAGPAAVRES